MGRHCSRFQFNFAFGLIWYDVEHGTPCLGETAKDTRVVVRGCTKRQDGIEGSDISVRQGKFFSDILVEEQELVVGGKVVHPLPKGEGIAGRSLDERTSPQRVLEGFNDLLSCVRVTGKIAVEML